MPQTEKIISERDGLSIGVIVALLSTMALGVTWGLRLEARVDVASALISTQDRQREEDLVETRFYTKTLQEVNIRLSRIEGRLGIEDSRQKGK